MTDSTSRATITAIQLDDHISIKIVSSWGDIALLEDWLEDELKMKITAFKPIKNDDGKEIGSELLYPNDHPVADVQDAINNIDWEE